MRGPPPPSVAALTELLAQVLSDILCHGPDLAHSLFKLVSGDHELLGPIPHFVVFFDVNSIPVGLPFFDLLSTISSPLIVPDCLPPPMQTVRGGSLTDIYTPKRRRELCLETARR